MRERLEQRFSKPIECSIEKTEGNYKITFPEPVIINHMVMEEEIKDGQKIIGFELCHTWFHIKPSVYAGSFVGHKHIAQFPNIYGKEFYLNITDASEGYELKSIKFYKV